MSNRSIAARLFCAIREGRAPHAILIVGTEGCGANELARRAAAVCCLGRDDPDALVNCPDYYALGPEPIKVGEVREVLGELNRRAFSGWRVVNFFDAHGMKKEAQNALLKTLEEPPMQTLLLLSGREAGLLPTILSRCALLRLGAEPEAEIAQGLRDAGMPEADAQLAAMMSLGAPGLARAFVEPEYAALRKEAIAQLMEVLSGLAPFETCRALIARQIGPKPEKGKSSKELSKPSTLAVLDVWQSLLRDVLRMSLGLGEIANLDETARVKDLCARFTTAQIQGMIDLLMQAQTRLDFAGPGMTMDRLITQLSDIL